MQLISRHLVTPGSWLFRRENLSWLRQQSLLRQLPFAYRQFATCCGTAFFRERVAEAMLRGLIAIDRTLGREGIVALTLNESTVFLDLHDPRFLRVPSEWKEAETRLTPLLRKGDTFVDVGANHGSYSLAAAGLVGWEGQIVAIEPQPRLANLVELTLQRTGVPFQVHAVALSSQSGSAMFFRPLATSGSGGLISGFSAVSRHRSFTVPVSTLDDLLGGLAFPGRVLLKLDIEGSELRCLQGATEFLRATRPRVLMEINPGALTKAEVDLEMLIATLERARYRFAETYSLDDVRSIRELRLRTGQGHREIVLLPEH